MHVVVTGGAGFIGAALLARLRSLLPEAQLTATVRRPPDTPLEGVEYRADVPAADVVYHLAGSKGIAPSLADPQGDLRANLVPTIDLLTSVAEATVVLASSCAVYGNVAMPASEDGPVRPLSPYGASKLAAEQYALMFHRSRGVDVRIARIGNPYGPGQRRLVVYDLARRALADGALTIRGDGTEVRDFIHVDDVAAALVAIGDAGDAGTTYNVASGAATSIMELARHVARAAGVAGEVQAAGGTEAGKVPVFLPSVERLRGLGFAPSRSLAEGIDETVAWIAEDT